MNVYEKGERVIVTPGPNNRNPVREGEGVIDWFYTDEERLYAVKHSDGKNSGMYRAAELTKVDE